LYSSNRQRAVYYNVTAVSTVVIVMSCISVSDITFMAKLAGTTDLLLKIQSNIKIQHKPTALIA